MPRTQPRVRAVLPARIRLDGRAGSARRRPTISQVAAKHSATPPQIALAWLLHRDERILLIPGTSSVAHLGENLAATAVGLDVANLATLEAAACRRRVTSDESEIIFDMRTTSVRVGDIVYANKRGRHFHAKVLELAAGGTLLVEPIERNISYRHLEASEVTEHWARNTPTRRAAGASKQQPTQLPLAL